MCYLLFGICFCFASANTVVLLMSVPVTKPVYLVLENIKKHEFFRFMHCVSVSSGGGGRGRTCNLNKTHKGLFILLFLFFDLNRILNRKLAFCDLRAVGLEQ